MIQQSSVVNFSTSGSKCSEDQVNDRLSDSSGGDKESDGSAASFGTNPFQFNDVSGLDRLALYPTNKF